MFAKIALRALADVAPLISPTVMPFLTRRRRTVSISKRNSTNTSFSRPLSLRAIISSVARSILLLFPRAALMSPSEAFGSRSSVPSTDSCPVSFPTCLAIDFGAVHICFEKQMNGSAYRSHGGVKRFLRSINAEKRMP